MGITAALQSPEWSDSDLSLLNDYLCVICPRDSLVGRQGLAHLRSDTHRNGRKVNVSSVFAIECASVHPQCCREFPRVVDHDDRDVSIGGP